MSAVEHREEVAARPGRALVPFVARPAQPTRPRWTFSVVVAASALALGLVGAGAYGLLRWPGGPGAGEASATASTLARLQDQVARLQHGIDTLRGAAEAAHTDDGVRGLRRGLDTLRQDVEQVRTSNAANLAALSTKIDKADHDPSQKLADIALRLDRIEKQAMASLPATGSVSAAPARPAPVPAPVPKPAVAAAPALKGGVTQVAGNALPNKAVTVGGWVLRDVYDGMALVQARGGGLREVEPGEYLPGAGQVRSIERRGRDWVVMTSRGVIDKATF